MNYKLNCFWIIYKYLSLETFFLFSSTDGLKISIIFKKFHLKCKRYNNIIVLEFFSIS